MKPLLPAHCSRVGGTSTVYSYSPQKGVLKPPAPNSICCSVISPPLLISRKFTGRRKRSCISNALVDGAVTDDRRGGEGTGALHLDEETFRRACQRFVQHSRTLSDGWSWEEVKGSDEGYMRKTVLVPGRTIAHPRDAGCGPGEDLDTLGQGEGQDFQDEEEVEEQAVGDEEQATSETTSAIRYEYHVLYSCSYQAPVLYFRASMLDGRPLSLEDMWGNVHPNYRQRLLQGPWDTITQQEHPLLGQPFFVLHPCRTQDLMRPLLAAASAENRSLNYIVSWLSSVGPVVALTIP